MSDHEQPATQDDEAAASHEDEGESRLTEARITVGIALPTAIVAVFAIVTADFPVSSRRAPIVVGAVCVALAAVALVRYGRLIATADGGLFPRPAKPGGSRVRPYLHAGVVLAALTAVYIVSLEWVNFFVLTGVFAGISAYALAGRPSGLRNIARYIAFAFGLPAGVYLAFVLLLTIRLP